MLCKLSIPLIRPRGPGSASRDTHRQSLFPTTSSQEESSLVRQLRGRPFGKQEVHKNLTRRLLQLWKLHGTLGASCIFFFLTCNLMRLSFWPCFNFEVRPLSSAHLGKLRAPMSLSVWLVIWREILTESRKCPKFWQLYRLSCTEKGKLLLTACWEREKGEMKSTHQNASRLSELAYGAEGRRRSRWPRRES